MKITPVISVALLLLSACHKEPPRRVSVPAPVATPSASVPSAPSKRYAINKAGAAQVRAVGGNTDIARLARKLLASKAGPLPASVRQAAKDPTPLLGRWQVVHTIYRTNGRSRGPSRPIVPTTWTFGRDGSFVVSGGMTIRGRYVFTGSALHVAALGPSTRYRIDARSATRMALTSTIAAGSLHIANTTVLRKL
ncbi:MAG: hypothetical protein KC503_06570 [Myxococcales bacterium]|nr:hypothetical protein [Myxococcales bacterium]